MRADLWGFKSLLFCQNGWRMKFVATIKLYRHCLADVDDFPPWSHANNTTHWGISVTLSRHTVPTWLLVTSVRGTRIFEHVTSFKTAKRCHSTHSKIQQMRNTTRREPHSTGMTADRPGVNCSCTPLLFFFFFFLHSPVQQRRTSMWGRRADKWGLFGLKCLRLKRTHRTQDQGAAAVRVFKHSRSTSVWDFSLHTELTFIYINHSSSF